jgi:hypothetical protein
LVLLGLWYCGEGLKASISGQQFDEAADSVE